MKAINLRNLSLFTVLVLVVGSTVGAQAGMISNGSFEDTTLHEWSATTGLAGLGGSTSNLMTDVTDWMAVASPDPNAAGECRWYVENTYASTDSSMLEPFDGRLMFALGNSSAVYQEFNVMTGNEYTVSYYEVSRSGSAESDLGLTATISGIAATGTLSQYANTNLADGWTLHSFSFIPTESGTARLTFTGAAGNGGMLDSVSVEATAVPEPGSMVLLLGGLVCLLIRRRR